MLDQILSTNVYQFLLVFSRLSLIFLLMPGISASYVPVRVRLLLGVMVSFLVMGLVKASLPEAPQSVADLAWRIMSEMLIGGFLGAVVQVIMSTLELAGNVIAQATGLTNALVDDPVTEEQSAVVIGLLDLVAVLMIFITGTHQLLIGAMVDSYNFLAPGAPLFTGDMLHMLSSLLNQCFDMALRLASPFLVFELVFQITSGVLSRLSPQLNIYFVALPGQIALGLAILMIALPTMMLVFLRFMENNLHALLTP
jgi:flagellar biosynthetic protein FliR